MRYLIIAMLAVATAAWAQPSAGKYKKLSLKEYRDKMKAGWIGQIAGVSWGGPTEFRYRERIIPETEMPKWTPNKINDAFGQDDLYVEMTFLRSMEQYGLDVSIRQAGIDFANTRYPLWCANNAGRSNLRSGIAPPDSSHPQFNKCPNDIDYQIEADYSGLIAPGLPNVAIEVGEKFGRLMNYGDGMYAGQFIGALYAAAFFETDPVKIIQEGLKSIPSESQYAEMARDMLAWHRADPNDWEKAWRLVQDKYRENPEYQKASNGGIDCKINGAYVLMGLLFGKSDLDQTIIISCRSGQDSDCNPSSSGGVLFTAVGYSKLPDRFKSELNQQTIFSHTAYNFPGLIDVCEKLARQFVVRAGGKISKDDNGDEFFMIPVQEPKPSKLELSWAPGPIANSRFTDEEMARITEGNSPAHMPEAVEKFAPGWRITKCGNDMNPGIRDEFAGEKNVLVTHPLNRDTGCVLSKKVTVPKDGKTVLRLVVGNDPQGDFELIVRVGGKEYMRKVVGSDTAATQWLRIVVDLSSYAGKDVQLELVNQANGWSYEAAYWSKISVATE